MDCQRRERCRAKAREDRGTLVAVPGQQQLDDDGRGLGMMRDAVLRESDAMTSWEPRRRVPPSLRPEMRLMLAVLEGAVEDFQKYAIARSGPGRRRFAEANAWFGATDVDGAFDFESICHALGIDPSYVRSGLRRWYVARHAASIATRPVLHFAFRRVSGTRHAIRLAS